jgi:glycogen operon protein
MDVDWKQSEGAPFPLGVSWIDDEHAFNFAIYSKHAESVELRFYGEDELENPRYQFRFDYLRNKSGPIWHCRLPESELERCRFYAYSISGPGPEPGFSWHTFDAEKLLLDPYAKAIFFPPAFDRDAARLPGSNEGRAPLGLLPRVLSTRAPQTTPSTFGERPQMCLSD